MDIVQALDRGLSILLCLAREKREIGATELSKLLDIPKATVIRLARTLEARDFIKQNPQTGAYNIGIRILMVSDSLLEQLDFRKICLKHMQKLSDLTGESVSLYVAEFDKRICVERVDSTAVGVPIIKVGYVVPINLGAAGKVLVAYDSSRTTNYGISENVLKETLKNGYAISKAERADGIFAIAVPVYDNKRKVICSISINGPFSHFEGERFKKMLEATLKAGQDASKELGYF